MSNFSVIDGESSAGGPGSRSEPRSWGCKSSTPKWHEHLELVYGEAEQTSIAALCGRVLDTAGSSVITRKFARLSTFALCRRLLRYAALKLVATKGQEKGNIGQEDVNTDDADRLLAGGPNLTNREIGFRTISACAEERHIGEFRRRVRQAITEVERGFVAASTEPRMRIDGGFPVVLAKRHDAYIPVGQKALKKHSGDVLNFL